MNLHIRVTSSARASLPDHPRPSSAILVVVLAALCFQPQALANTINVSSAAGLRAALVTVAANGEDDVIVLAAGTYATDGAAFTFVANENNTLTLEGANGTTRDQVVLDGGGASQVLKFECVGNCGAITLRGLTVQNGNSAVGGGVTASQSSVFSDVNFFGNHSEGSGGAISGNDVNVANSIFSNNSAADGGAISGTAIVTNSIFSGNTATLGSGGAIFASIVAVANSAFNNNTALSGEGGAIFAYSGATSTSGVIVNTTFSGNAAGGLGAAIRLYSTGSIINSVFYGHSTPAIYAGSVYNLYNNLIDTSTGIAGSTPIMAGNVAPGTTSPFVNAAIGDFRLAARSLAIDGALDPNSTTFANLAGSTTDALRQTLLTDLQGSPRPAAGTAVDIGAYELSDSDRLFDYAEYVLPSLFGPPSSSLIIAQYYARCYHGQTVCIGTSGGDVYLYDGTVIANFGPLANFMAEVGRAGF